MASPTERRIDPQEFDALGDNDCRCALSVKACLCWHEGEDGKPFSHCGCRCCCPCEDDREWIYGAKDGEWATIRQPITR